MGKVEVPVADVWTDGASSWNTRHGGWGLVMYLHSERREYSGGESDTTNNRMELMAAIVALEVLADESRARDLKYGYEVLIRSDAAYLVNAMRQKWIHMWRNKGWLNSAGEEVKNRDLWERLEAAMSFHHKVVWIKVKGHSKTNKYPDNDRADELAVAAKKAVMAEKGEDD